MDTVNSKEYWDKRFETGDWDEQGGKEQSLFFAELAYDIMPDFLKQELGRNSWTVVDIGCAEGEGTASLARRFPLCRFTGVDFSGEAIKTATQRHSNCDFHVQDIYQEVMEADVVYSSNTLEHMKDPLGLMEKMCGAAKKYVVLLLPLEDYYVRIAEHINTFSLETFPLHMAHFYLSSYRIVDCRNMVGTQWPGKQIILVYTSQTYCENQLTLRDIHDNFVGEEAQLIAELEAQLHQSEDNIREAQERATQMEESRLHSEKLCKDLQGVLEKEKLTVQHLSEQTETQKLHFEEDLRREKLAVRSLTEQAEEQKQRFEEELRQKESDMEEVAIQLEECKKKEAQLKKELSERNRVYDDLYSYSYRRDIELDRTVNSRSYKFFAKFIKPPLHIGNKIVSKLGRMLKYLFTFRLKDFAQEIYMPFQRVFARVRGKAQLKKKMAELRKSISGKRVIIFPSTIDWHMRLFQRPQQLALAYAKKKDTAVIYMTGNMTDDHVSVTECVASNLWLVYNGYEKELTESLPAAKEVVMSLSWTINAGYYDTMKPDKLIYEYIDELEIFDAYDSKMIADHHKMMGIADVTVCTATKLYKQALGKAKNPILSPNAGDYEFFLKTPDTPVSSLITNAVKGYKCVLGYYGALAMWFDYELVKEVARRHPDWLFVLIGMNYDGTLDKSGVNKIKNILYVPPQPYQTLPSLLTAFDVATIPFVINEITLSTSPVKLFEYMAGGKPILTSKMPECLKYESVRTYADVDEFCRIVEEYMAMKPEDPYWEVLKREALENTWDARTDQILEALGEN